MSFLDLFLPSEKTAGKAQMAFDHPTVYNQLTSGQGPEGLSRAADGLAKGIVSRLEAMDSNLQRALKTSQGAWAGHAADSASSSTTPLSDAVQSSREISGEIGKQVNIQADHFGKVKTMPPPKKVDPIDLGIGGYTPGGFLAEQVDKEIQERQANAVEEAARQQYTTYQESTTSTTGSMTRYSPVPNPLTSVGTADTRPPGTVDPNTGYTGRDTGDTGTTSDTGSTDDSQGTIDSFEKTDTGSSHWRDDLQPGNIPPEDFGKHGFNWTPPDQTHSEWNTPTPSPGPGQPSPTPPPTGTGGGAGAGAIGMMPGGGAAGGGAGGAGGTTGRGGSMGGRIGPGGSAGVGGTGGSTTGGTTGGSTTGARGGTGAGAMGGGAGRGRGGEEDEEHQRKYVEDSDEPFEFDGEVDEEGNVVAPPVIGQYRPPSHDQ